jgi:hypothetical protein
MSTEEMCQETGGLQRLECNMQSYTVEYFLTVTIVCWKNSFAEDLVVIF